MSSVAPSAQARMTSWRNLISSSILAAENIVRMGMIALVSMWIAHQLGPEGFGVLNYASAVLAVFWSMALLGLDTPLVARLTQSTLPGDLLGSAIILRVLAGLVGMACVITTVLLTRQDDPTAVLVGLIVSLSIPLSAPMVLDVWFKAHNQPLPAAIARIAATALSCASKVACILFGWGLIGLAATVALEGLLTAVALWLAYRGSRGADPVAVLAASRRTVLDLLRKCWPFLLSTAAIAAYMKVDVILLGILSTNRETGIYSLSQKLAETLYMLPVVVVEVLYPQLVKDHSGQHGAPATTTQNFFDLVVAVALLATAISVVVVYWLVPPLFGAAYARTADVFLVHAWSCLGVALAHARYKWMAAAGLQALAPFITLAGLALSVACNLLLIPAYGAMGAAVATVLSHLAGGLALTLVWPQTRKVAALQLKALWPWLRLFRQLRAA